MELSFLLAAMRRRSWLVVPFVLLGLVPGILARFNEKTLFASSSVLLVSPPSIGVAGSSVSDVERYVSNQIAVLETLTDRVAAAITTTPVTGSLVFEMVSFKHKQGTDIVAIEVQGENPDLVRTVASTYANLYIEDLRARSIGAQSNEIKQLDDRLTQLKAEVGKVDAALAAKLSLPGIANRSDLQLESVDPVLSSQRTQLNEEYRLVLANKNQLEQNSKLKITSEIVQQAPPPRLVTQAASKIILVAGVFAGGVLGVVAAVMAARLSATLLDHVHAEEILGMPVPHSLEYVGSLHREPRSAVTSLPAKWIAPTDHICVRAESVAAVGETLTIVVCGTERGAGATTLALALAGRFAVQGANVILIDADVRDADVSHIFETPVRGGVDELLANRALGIKSLLVPSPVEGLTILGLGGRTRQLRRDEVPVLVSSAQHEADVVIIDGGPVLESASTLQLTQLVDAVVLAVPGRYQRIDSLEVVARQLKSPRVMLLPVLTEPKRPRMFVLPTFRKKASPVYAMPVMRSANGDRGDDHGEPRDRVEVVNAGGGHGGWDKENGPRSARPRARNVHVTPVNDRRDEADDREERDKATFLEDEDLEKLRRSSLRRFRD